MARIFTCLLFWALCSEQAHTQCINTFPYLQDFEANNGGWTSGGVGNDWAWGSPSKPVIAQAASGNNCWITGGTTVSFYNNGERSYVQSPCFDLSTLQHPFLSLHIYWESERVYDGSNIQYSLNGGTTWANVGSFSDPVNCLNQNWYNTANITNLTTLATVKEGWSGNIQPTAGSCQGGSGSAGWKLATHCISYLAGQPNVIFRFTFGAGTTCNNFDGIAFDDFGISEAPANTADFTYTCNGNTVTFNGITTLCPDTLLWDFGDAGSGANNAATGQNPTHTFSAAGTYSVTFNVRGPCNSPSTIIKQIQILDVSATATPATCSGASDGTAITTVTGSAGPFTYNWSTTPAQTSDTAVNLSPGTYSVTVSAAGSCGGTANVTVTAGADITLSVTATATPCGGSGGSLSATTLTGNGPFIYAWSNGGTTSTINNVAAGTYTVTVTGAAGCTATGSVTVNATGAEVVTVAGQTNVACAGNSDGAVTLSVTGGQQPYTYLWSNGATTDNLSNLSAGNYTVTVTDAANCAVPLPVTITGNPALQLSLSSTTATCGFSDGTASAIVSGGVSPYTYAWSNGSSNAADTAIATGTYSITITDAVNCTTHDTISVPVVSGMHITLTELSNVSCFKGSDGQLKVSADGGTAPYFYLWSNSRADSAINNLNTGSYQVRVTDANNCSASATFTVVKDTCPSYVYFPTAFSPNGDGVNETFKPKYSPDLQKYHIRIYNRWGELVYESTDVNEGWDGTYKDTKQPLSVFVWMAEYSFLDNAKHTQAGNVTLMR